MNIKGLLAMLSNRPKTQHIRQDGKNYEFTPGPNAELIVRNPNPPQPGFHIKQGPSRAKIVSPNRYALKSMGRSQVYDYE